VPFIEAEQASGRVSVELALYPCKPALLSTSQLNSRARFGII
jgi:hypothetical protein